MNDTTRRTGRRATTTRTGHRSPKGYQASSYPPFAVTVDIVWLTIRHGRLSVLLVERGDDPYAGCWALPGGFVNIDEDIAAAAERELLEETGLEVLPTGAHLEQLGTYGTPGRDPRMRVVSVAHVALTPDVGDPRAGSDASAARWWPVADLAAEGVELAFDHQRILDDGIARARAKLEYTTLAASFVTEPFTMSELRAVYETVWGVTMDQSNFRRKVLDTTGFVEPAGQKTGARGRPAELYRRGPAQTLMPPFERPTSSEA